MKWFAKFANIVPVDPDAHLLRAMKTGAYGLQKGLILCIFPEGGRSFDEEMQDFKKGAAILSDELGVPMVPVGIQGTHKVWPRNSNRIRLHKIKIEIGKPLVPSPGEDPYETDISRLRAAVQNLID
jgi:1-acyl-sn-glycerol-3-phosphate acyltransferase